MIRVVGITVALLMVASAVRAQSNNQIEPPKKANARATATPAPAGDPFEGASLEAMAGQCVTLEEALSEDGQGCSTQGGSRGGLAAGALLFAAALARRRSRRSQNR